MLRSTAFEARPHVLILHAVLRTLRVLSYFILIIVPVKELLLCIGHQVLLKLLCES